MRNVKNLLTLWGRLQPALVAFVCAAAAFGGELVLPSTSLERQGTAAAVYRLNSVATGKGTLAVQWTDVHGRVVDDRKIPVELNDENEIAFSLDLSRAAGMKNVLRAHLTFEGRNKKDQADRRDEKAELEFLARPAERVWRDYQIVMWQNYPVESWPALKSAGINAGQYNGRTRVPAPFLFPHDLRWYVENIATDFYAEYHRYRADRRPNWPYDEAKALYKKDPTSKEAFKRHPSLSDPVWQQKIRERLVEVARAHSPYRPLFYDLGDESGIADLAAFWDFDFSDHSLVAMRAWLKERYGTLDALNRQWGSSFGKWELVKPQTTSEAMRRTDDNYSSWADFKEWMDVAFARALKMGVDAIRSVDPGAHVGLAGCQMPGWGGYDYARLADTLTFFEPYDIGNNIEIIRSLAPGTPVVTTSFARGPWEKHRVWYELLHGNRGIILWDDKREFVNADGSLGPRGAEVKPYYEELRSGVGALLVNSRRTADRVAIHYSQASMRTDWMLRQKRKGDAWVDRNSSTERRDSEFMRLRESWCRLIEDLGLQYDFVSYGQVEGGELARRGYQALVLPDSNSLSEAEARAIADFAARGGAILSNSEPGTFDEHSRRLPAGRLAGLRTLPVAGDLLNYHQARLVGKEGAVLEAARNAFRQAGVKPEIALSHEGAAMGVELHRFRNGGMTIAALLTNPQLRVDELGPPEFKSNQRFEQPRKVRLTLREPMQAYDIRKGRDLGRQKELAVTVDPYEPALFALLAAPASALEVTAPAQVRRGENAQVGMRVDSAAAVHVFQVDVLDPAGKRVEHYSGNVYAAQGAAGKTIPLAHNDAAGRWQVRVRDVVTGQTKTAAFEVR